MGSKDRFTTIKSERNQDEKTYLPFVLLGTNRYSARQTQAIFLKLISRDGRHALLVNGKPFFMLGAQVHNSSGWPGMLPRDMVLPLNR